MRDLFGPAQFDRVEIGSKPRLEVGADGRPAPGADLSPYPAVAARQLSAREHARRHTEMAVRVLAEIAEDSQQKAADRINAAKALAQLGWGSEGSGESRSQPQVTAHLHLEALRLSGAQDQHAKVIEHLRKGTDGVHDAT